MRSNAKTAVVALVVALVVGGTAYAAGKINGHDIKKGTIPFGRLDKKAQKKVLQHSVKGTRISKSSVPFGKLNKDARNKILSNPGPTGATGPTGSAVYTGANWGVLYRNTIGSPVAVLRGGPGKPPFGVGSLSIEVANTSAETEQVVFGNETDFVGQSVADINQVGFHVFTTLENSAQGVNMPSIRFEINPGGAGGTTTNYSNLEFIPAQNSAPGQWSPYIDGTTGAGTWALSGSQFNSPATQANCGLDGPKCSFAQVKAFLATGSGAKIISVGVGKGRDFAFQGAVDGLRLNDKVYDFEPFGVNTLSAG